MPDTQPPPPTGRAVDDDSMTVAAADDPVRQARKWLAERGLSESVWELSRPGSPAAPVGRAVPARSDPVMGAPSEQSVDVRGMQGQAPSQARSGVEPQEEPAADPEAIARSIVLSKLTAQARTRQELDRALKARRVPGDAAKAVLDRLESVGLVDDAAFARDWVESRQQSRHLSKTALRRELTAKGVDGDKIDSALAMVDTEDELQVARRLADKKMRSLAGLGHDVQRRRLASALSRRGFGSGVVSRVVTEALRSADA